jgi:hypothetical protein
MVIWMIVLTVSVSAIIISAAAGLPTIHAFVAGIVAVSMALLSLKEQTTISAEGGDERLMAASSARYMGLVWAWAALSIFVCYFPYFNIIRWPEWLPFALVCAAVAGLCLFFGMTLNAEAEKGSDDDTMTNLAYYLNVGQFAGMLVAMVGLALDGKFPAKVNANPGWQDWAANNTFFFGALALAVISGYALFVANRKRKEIRAD